MLTKLHFKNFKAWEDSSELRLAPITVFFGTNSAGKSSIPQLLLMLKQTAESPDRQRALHLGDSRTLVELGTYDDVVHGRDVDRPLEISFEWTLEPKLTVNDPVSGEKYQGDALRFECTIESDEKHQPSVRSLAYTLLQGDAAVLDITMRQRASKFDLHSDRYKLTRQRGRAWQLPSPSRFYGFPDEAVAYYQNTEFAADLVLALERLLMQIFYVGPLREYPKRLYLWSGEVPNHVGAKGERAIEALLASEERWFNFKRKHKTKSLPTLVAERLRKMGLISDFEVKPLGEHRKEHEVLVRTSPKLPQVHLTDVGFGVSQVLPVIVECLYVPRRSIVFFEQPEIHHQRVS